MEVIQVNIQIGTDDGSFTNLYFLEKEKIEKLRKETGFLSDLIRETEETEVKE